MKLAGFSLRAIGRRIGRDHTSVMREINRNRPTYADDAVYWYYVTQTIADERCHQARSFRRKKFKPLVEYVESKLRLDWPPEAISERLHVDYPEDERMRVSHETIYRWVYLAATQKRDLHTHLRRRHKKRRKQKRYGSGRRFIPGRVSIAQRPSIVGTRERFGDWEGDTVEGAKGTGGVATHVERKSRYLLAVKLHDKKASTMTEQSTKSFRRVPKRLRKTLTVDNGKEFSRFKELEENTGLEVFFADPYAAWQRGTNENTNGLLRFYFPKGTDFRKTSEEELAIVVEKLNHRPRKCLNYRTPHEVFYQARRGALTM